MAQLIAIDKIVVAPNRQRRDLDDETLAELARSIKTTGLLHAPICRVNSDQLDSPILVAGERRLRALALAHKLGWRVRYEGEEIPAGYAPYTNLGDLDAIAAEEAELEENVKRKDLTWQERAAAESRLHNLRSAQAAAAGVGHSVRQTAEEIHGRSDGYYQDSVRTNLVVAQHLGDPDVAKAATAKDAFKVLKRKEEVRKNEARAKELGMQSISDLHQCFNTDFRNLRISDTTLFDVILTDPPYGINASDFGDSGGKIIQGSEAHRYDDSYESWRTLMLEFTNCSAQVTKPQAHAYLFCDLDRFHELKKMMDQVGWAVHRTPLIWHKAGNGGRVPWPLEGPRRHYEIILYAVKGKRPVNFIGPDVISCPNDEVNLGHGAQKPVPLFVELLRRSAKPGDRVLDAFCGTGPIFPAAHEVKCLATGIELDPATYAIAAGRLAALK